MVAIPFMFFSFVYFRFFFLFQWCSTATQQDNGHNCGVMVYFYCKYLLEFGLTQNPKFDFSQSLFKGDSNRTTSRRKIGFDTVKFAIGSTFKQNMKCLKNIEHIVSFRRELLKFVTNLEIMSKKKGCVYNNALATII